MLMTSRKAFRTSFLRSDVFAFSTRSLGPARISRTISRAPLRGAVWLYRHSIASSLFAHVAEFNFSVTSFREKKLRFGAELNPLTPNWQSQRDVQAPSTDSGNQQGFLLQSQVYRLRWNAALGRVSVSQSKNEPGRSVHAKVSLPNQAGEQKKEATGK